jgi:hypothetical protein
MQGLLPRPGYTSSIETRRPTITAAVLKIERVMSFLGSSSRSACMRLVLSSAAILFLEIFFFFIAIVANSFR